MCDKCKNRGFVVDMPILLRYCSSYKTVVV